MSCNLTYSVTQSCRSSIGGVDSVYIGNWSNDLTYSFAESDIFTQMAVATTGGLTYAVYRIEYTEPLGPTAPQVTRPIRPATGSVITVQLDDPGSTFSYLNGTGSVVIAARGAGGVTLIRTDQPLYATSSTAGLTGSTGNLIYDFNVGEITVLPIIPFYQIMQGEETAEFIQTEISSNDNFSTVWEQELSITLYGLMTTKSLVEILAWGRWVILIKDYNGTWRLMGYDDGAYVTDTDISVGRTRGELNGAKIKFKSSGAIAPKVRATAATQRIEEA